MEMHEEAKKLYQSVERNYTLKMLILMNRNGKFSSKPEKLIVSWKD